MTGSKRVRRQASKSPPKAPADPGRYGRVENGVDLYDRSLYINREISWLAFNGRCLEEAFDKTNPLLERVKFLAICFGNLDEFFMIRMPGLLFSNTDNIANLGPDSFEDEGQLVNILNEKVGELIDGYEECWSVLEEDLGKVGILFPRISDLDPKQKMWVDDYYNERVHPLLTPLALDISHPFPFISNNSLNLAVRLRNSEGEVLYARLKVPVGILPRFVAIPSASGKREFVLLENIIKDNVSRLFPGFEILGCYKFRITRNADVKVTIDEAVDLMSAVETAIDSRDLGFPVRMVVEDSMPRDLAGVFARNLNLRDNQVTTATEQGMMHTDLWELYGLNIPSMKERPFKPYVPPEISESASMFDAIKRRDWILYHPYETFDTVIRFMRESADDPNVQSIKICLYRLGKKSEVIRELMRAKEKGKTVSVLMELRAKFDEVNNISLAKKLEKLGVHVVYGPVDLKVHSKLLQVVRLEGEHLVRYTHLSSGNYNSNTARMYSDISYLTANQEIGEDVGELFNALTGYFGPREYRHLLVAPLTLKSSLIALIRREAETQRRGGKAYIAMKANGLIDSDIIAELYRASMAGVKIDLNIRGLCCLRPGVPGVSDSITVTSVVDRFLEHSRIYYFENDGDPSMYMGSSDMMPRNLLARVEVLFPVLDRSMLASIRDRILKVNLSDNVKARVLGPDGSYALRRPAEGEKPVRSQKWFLENRGVWHGQPRDRRVHRRGVQLGPHAGRQVLRGVPRDPRVLRQGVAPHRKERLRERPDRPRHRREGQARDSQVQERGREHGRDLRGGLRHLRREGGVEHGGPRGRRRGGRGGSQGYTRDGRGEAGAPRGPGTRGEGAHPRHRSGRGQHRDRRRRGRRGPLPRQPEARRGPPRLRVGRGPDAPGPRQEVRRAQAPRRGPVVPHRGQGEGARILQGGGVLRHLHGAGRDMRRPARGRGRDLS